MLHEKVRLIFKEKMTALLTVPAPEPPQEPKAGKGKDAPASITPAAAVSPQEVLLWVEIVKLIITLLNGGDTDTDIIQTVNDVVDALPEETKEEAAKKAEGFLAWLPVVTSIQQLFDFLKHE